MEFPSLKNLPQKEFPSISIQDKLEVIEKSTAIVKNIVIGVDKGKKIDTNWLILLGKVIEKSVPNYRNANIWLDISRPKVIFIAGRRGRGKSYDLGVIAEGLVSTSNKISLKKEKISGIFFDLQNIFWTMLFEPLESDPEEKKQLKMLDEWGLESNTMDVRVFVPQGAENKMPSFREFSIKPSELSDEDWCGLFGYDKYGQPSGQLLSAAYRKVTKDGYAGRKAKLDYLIDDLIYCIENDRGINDEQRGFVANVRHGVLQKLYEAREWNVFSSAGTSIDEIYTPGTLSLMLLKGLDIETQTLIVGLLTKKIYEARSKSHEIGQQYKRLKTLNKPEDQEYIEELEKKLEKLNFPPCWIFLDEAHVLCPSQGNTTAKKHLINYVKLGRNKGLSMVFATQQPASVDSNLVSQRDIIICHTLGISKDIVAAESQIGCEIPQTIKIGTEKYTTNVFQRLVRSLGRGDAIFADDELNRIFLGRIRPRISAHGGADESLNKYFSAHKSSP